MIATKDNAPPIAVGQGVKSGEAGNLRRNSSTGSSNEPPGQCSINRSGCLVCRRWNRIIREIEQRRSDSLRRQALGNRMRGAM